MPTRGFLTKSFDVEKRRFVVQMLIFDNGIFVSITEGTSKIGPMVVGIGVGPATSTVTVIPAKTESLFLKLTAEQICAATKGISIVTASVNQLDSASAKGLMSRILEMVNE